MSRWFPSKALLCALFASAVSAQTTGTISGRVIDAATRKPVVGQRVTVVSSEAMGERWAVTDDAGAFTIDHLSPGTYRVRVTRSGFEPLRLQQLVVSATLTTSLELSLLPPGLDAGTPTEPSSVDVTSPSQTTVATPALIDRVPLVRPNATGLRSFADVAMLAPQVTRDALGLGLSGGLSSEHSTFIDGMLVNDPSFGGLVTPLGIGGAQLPLEFLERVGVTTTGTSPLFSRGGGGALNAVTKSGSNEVHGSVFGSWWPGALTATPRALPNDVTAFDLSSKRHNTGDFGAEVGGPVIRDRLWFYAGVVQAVDRRRLTRTTKRFTLTDDGRDFARDELGGFLTEPLETASTFDDRKSTTWLGKLSLKLTERQSLALTVFGSPQQRAIAPTSGLSPGVLDTTDSVTASLRYLGRFFDDALTVEAVAGYSRTSHARLPHDGARPGDERTSTTTTRTVLADDVLPSPGTGLSPGTLEPCAPMGAPVRSASGRWVVPCPVASINAPLVLGGRGLLLEADADRLHTRAVAGLRFRALGQHLVRLGADADWSQVRSTAALSGAGVVVERQAGREVLGLAQTSSTLTQLSAGAFLDEQWRVLDALTVNAGLRFDTQHFFDAGRAAVSLHQLSPRVGLVYDVAQNGRGKVFGHYAAYHQSLPFEVVRPAVDGSPRFRPGPSTCDPLDASSLRRDCATSPAVEDSLSGPVTVDPALKPMAHAELSAGLEYEVLPRFRVGLSGTHRWLMSSVELLSTDDGASVFLGTPGVGLASGVAAPERKYFATTLFATKDFHGGWLAQGSYTLSSLTGNTAGVFRQGPGRGDVHLSSATTNESGPLPADTSHQLKLYLAKDFELSSSVSLLVGASYEGFSGTPLSYLARHATAGLDATYVLPRGAAGRTPWTHAVNVRAGLAVKVAPEQTMQVTLDVFNLLNLQEAIEVDQRLSARELTPLTPTDGQDARALACFLGNVPTCQSQLSGPAGQPWPLLNPTFKQATAYQQPLSVRLGVRFNF